MVAEAAGGVALAGGLLFWLQTSWDAPAAVMVQPWHDTLDANGSAAAARRLTSDAVSSPGWSPPLVQPMPVTFRGQATLLHGQLFTPSRPSGAGVVYTHGGSERQSFGAFHFSAVYAQQYALNQWLASSGLTVLSVNYRSGVGYGAAFRLCEGCMSKGAAEYQDVKTAALYLGQQNASRVHPKRVGVWGISYGGLNALQAVPRDSDVHSGYSGYMAVT